MLRQLVVQGVLSRLRWTSDHLRGSFDLQRLRRHRPFPTEDDLARARRDLEPAYRGYVSNVSSVGMAASLETSAFLLALCRVTEAESALDLGSGFSSYVLRFYARESGARVASVDDDAEWLVRTKEFLASHDLPVTNLSLWPEIPNGTYDVVFHDLAQGDVRETAMPVAMERARRFVVFDDAHHLGHRRAMNAVSSELLSLRAVTCDRMKRFAMLAVARGDVTNRRG